MVFTASDRPEREMTASGASVRGRRFRAPKKRENLFFFLKKKLKNFLVKDPNGRQEEDEKREKEEGKKKKRWRKARATVPKQRTHRSHFHLKELKLFGWFQLFF